MFCANVTSAELCAFAAGAVELAGEVVCAGWVSELLHAVNATMAATAAAPINKDFVITT